MTNDEKGFEGGRGEAGGGSGRGKSLMYPGRRGMGCGDGHAGYFREKQKVGLR